MKLEHHKQKVAPISEFFIRLGRYGLFAIILILFSVLLGNSLYSGVAFLSIAAVFFTPIIHRILHTLHVEYDDNEK
jgi:hypothetical protein